MAPTIPEAAWRKGTQWAAVTRAHAELFVEDELVFSVMRRHCRTWADPEGRYGSFCAGDEHYPQVLLQLRGRDHEIERRPVTFANWFPTSRSHPKLYVVQEITAELVTDLQVRRACALRLVSLSLRRLRVVCTEPNGALASDGGRALALRSRQRPQDVRVVAQR